MLAFFYGQWVILGVAIQYHIRPLRHQAMPDCIISRIVSGLVNIIPVIFTHAGMQHHDISPRAA